MEYISGIIKIIGKKILINDFDKKIERADDIIPYYKQYYYYFLEANEIIPSLYLGSSFNAYSYTEISTKHINIIFNITNTIDNFHNNNPFITYYNFPISDNNKDDITNILSETSELIHKHLLNNDKILVHCFMGASRSASVIIYYLMKYKKMSYFFAKNYVLSKRPIINLSKLFENKLKNF
jgi:atypical dual specificity phosphatase